MAAVTVYYAPDNKRSKTLGEASYKGLKRIGEKVNIQTSTSYNGVNSEYAVFYGLSSGLHKIFNDYKRHGTAIYIDLGYWHRRIRTRYDGYHKIIVNSRHPTDYFQRLTHDSKRFKELHIKIVPWRKKDGPILLAGMSAKAAIAEDLPPFAWEKEALRRLLKLTDRPVIYRPKPNCIQSRPLPGAGYNKKGDLQIALQNCHAVVTRHSNTAVDAVLAGVPVFCMKGAASVMGHQDLSLIETPFYPDNRKQWASDLAWCQFTTAEIASGLPWRHLKDEGLIP